MKSLMPAGEKNRRNFLAFILLVLIYFIVYWRDLFIHNLLPLSEDGLVLFYPSWCIYKSLIKEGFSILWDPFRNMGEPFLASPQNMALYPFNLLSVAVDYLTYQKIFLLFHTFLIVIFSYLLGRKMFNSELCGYGAALGMAFNGFFASRFPFTPHFATMAWAPCILYLIYTNRPVLGGIAIAMSWFAGFPPLFILLLLFLSLMISVSDSPVKYFKCLVFSGVIAAGLSAIQYIPFIEMLRQSNRPLFLEGSSVLKYSADPIFNLKQLFSPGFLIEGQFGGRHVFSFFSCGIVMLTLGLYAVWKGGRRERILFAFAIVFLVLSTGSSLGFYEYIPLITIFRFPSNWLFLFVISFILAGCSGIQYVKPKSVQIFVLCLLAFDLFSLQIPNTILWRTEKESTEASVRLLGLEKKGDGRIFHKRDMIDVLIKKRANSDYYWQLMKGVLLPSFGVGLGFHEASSNHNLTSRRNIEFIKRLESADYDSTLFDIAGISQIVHLNKDKPAENFNSFKVFENANFKNRVFWKDGASSSIGIAFDKPGQAEFEANGPGELVFSESYYPGWKVKVNNHLNTPQIYEQYFMSIALEEGPQTIRFFYRPGSFFIGLAIFIGTLLMLIFWPFFRKI